MYANQIGQPTIVTYIPILSYKNGFTIP